MGEYINFFFWGGGVFVVLYSLVCAIFMQQDLHHDHVHSLVDQEVFGNKKECASFQGL